MGDAPNMTVSGQGGRMETHAMTLSPVPVGPITVYYDYDVYVYVVLLGMNAYCCSGASYDVHGCYCVL